MTLIDEAIFERHSTTWRDISVELTRRWRLIVVVWVVTVLSTYVGLQLMTERFESKATVLVKLGRENAELPTTVQNSGMITTGVSRDVVNSEMQILTSSNLIEQTVDQLGPGVFAFKPAPPRGFLGTIRYGVKLTVRWLKNQGQEVLYAVNLKKRISQREAAIQLLTDSLHVDVEKDSNVIAVSAELPDPAFCVRVTNTLLERYLDEHQRAWRSPESKGFFLAQREENRQRLEDLQKVRDQVRAKWKLSSVNEQRSALLRELSDLNNQIQSNKVERDDLDRESAVMATRVEALPERQNSTEVQTQNSSIQSIKERLTALELERAKLLSRYQPGREPVKKVEAEIGDLRDLLNSQPPTLLGSVSSEINPIRQTFSQGVEQYRVKIAGLEEKNRTLSAGVNEIQRQLRALNDGEDQLDIVERDLKVAQDNYLTYAKRMEEDRISEELDLSHVTNVVVLSPASTPLEPVYPRRLLIMGVAVGLGLVLGISLAFLLEYLDDTIRKSQDIADLEDLHVLGTFHIDQQRKTA
jgi:polysaccharide biosynthesis protein PslE